MYFFNLVTNVTIGLTSISVKFSIPETLGGDLFCADGIFNRWTCCALWGSTPFNYGFLLTVKV